MSRTVTAIITAGRNRGKQQRGMRTKALMKGLGTRPDCQLRCFRKNRENIVEMAEIDFLRKTDHYVMVSNR